MPTTENQNQTTTTTARDELTAEEAKAVITDIFQVVGKVHRAAIDVLKSINRDQEASTFIAGRPEILLSVVTLALALDESEALAQNLSQDFGGLTG